MATYFLLIKAFSRGKGARATRSAAYRAGETIRDERTSAVYNFSSRQDVVHKEIVLPSQFANSADVNWARDRSTLWNAAEHAGRQRNSRVAREVLVFLPPELTPTQRTNLVRAFSRELADHYRNAVDVTIHPPRPGADERHHHAHLLMTTREVIPQGLGPRTTMELGGRERRARGLGPAKDEYFWVRERWAQFSNEALREAGIAARIDHRSFKDQGIDREPTPAMPQKIYYQERKSGTRTQAGDDIRARHRERVEARLKGGDELARVLQRQKEEARQRAIASSKEKEGLPKKSARGALTREELNKLRREWHHANKEAVSKRRRERYKEDIAVERQKHRARVQANAQQVNERGKQLRKANADRVDQRERERWSKVRESQQATAKVAQQSTLGDRNVRSLGQASPPATAEESARKWLEFSKRQKQAPTAEESARKWLEFSERQKQAPTAEESARKWLEFSERQKQAPTAEESAKKWLEFSERQKQAPTAEESARKWLEFSESQKQTDPSQTSTEKRSDEHGFGGNADANDDDEDHGRKTDRSRDNDYGL
jgi:hypothetical protein